MISMPKIGLLPFYLKLYDQTVPEAFPRFEALINPIVDGFKAENLDVVLADVCRVAPQFEEAVRRFEAEPVDLIVTLHLAYSPSLESCKVLAKTPLPILMLDTTMDYDFGPNVEADRIMFNHGIHGVQDLASMLRRLGKPFRIVAGHVSESDVLHRAAQTARAAHAASLLRNAHTLRVGEAFPGMGDFSVSEPVLQDALGIAVETIGIDALVSGVLSVTDDEINAEIKKDRQRFVLDLPDEAHRRSVQVGLGLRCFLETTECTAFSMNFMAFDHPDGPVDTVPFLEASKAMARGLGYAGEGDVLTASLVGALNGAFGLATFTEIFCPDWKGGTLFLSHMGEINPELAIDRPRVFEKPFPFTPAQNPAVLTCSVKPGPAVLVNLLPAPDDRFELIIAPVEILGDTTQPSMHDTIRTWVRPSCDLATFLERYSELGGTHHSALVLGDCTKAIEAFAVFAGIKATVI